MTAPAAGVAAAGPAEAGAARRRRRAAWLVAALVALRVLALVGALATHPDEEGSIIGGDARRYQQIADAEGVPYRDVRIEYPPGTVVVIEAVDADGLLASQIRLGISQLVADLATAAVLAWGFRRRVGIAYLVLGTPFLAFPFLYLRVDLVSVLLAAAAVAVAHRRRDAWGDAGAGALVAVAVLTKLWPFVLVPLLVVERRWRALAWCVGTGALLGLAWLGVAGVDGVRDVVSFRGAEGWQLESVTGIVVHVADPARAHVEAGAWRTGTMPAGARALLSALSLATAGLAWWWAWRPRGSATALAPTTLRYGLAPFAAVLGLLVFAPIISPQYVLWLLPFAAVAVVGGDRTTGWLTLAAGALSTLSLALIRGQIAGSAWGTLPVLARNVVLVWALAHVAAVLSGARSLPHAPPSVGKPDPGEKTSSPAVSD